MNDVEVSSMVRESVAGVRSATPVDQIISRGHAVRARRRRVPAAAAALAVAGGAALGVTALAPAGHPAPTAAGSHPAVVRLAAWTVARQSNGDINITIRQLEHPAQLQATLRADGLPAHVSFYDDPGSAVCQPDTHASPKLYGSLAGNLYRALASNGSYFFTIRPSQLPHGVGVSIGVEKMKGFPEPAIVLRLVYASPQCTG